MFKYIVFITATIFLLTIFASPCFSIQDGPTQGENPDPVSEMAPSSPPLALNENETIMIQSTHNVQEISDKLYSYFVQAGGVLPIYDEDFREFVDYGASITLGIKREITSRLFLVPTIGMTLLNGDWNSGQEREGIFADSGLYFPNYPDMTDPEDLPDINQGVSYSTGGEGFILSSELLRHIDLKTSLYILPVAINVVYRLHGEGEKKINPYIDGGLGVCVAWREVESRTLKQKYYEGPVYSLTYNDNQTVTGQLLQVFGGIEVPFGGNMKFIANIATTLYDLRQFEPILAISASRPNPAWNEGPQPVTFSYEDSLNIGVFREEWVSSASIGVVVPF